jgi:hypothetical protein
MHLLATIVRARSARTVALSIPVVAAALVFGSTAAYANVAVTQGLCRVGRLPVQDRLYPQRRGTFRARHWYRQIDLRRQQVQRPAPCAQTATGVMRAECLC